MADKVSAQTYGSPSSQSNVTTSGSINANACTFAWDDATSMQEVMELLEKTKVQVMDYYSKR